MRNNKCYERIPENTTYVEGSASDGGVHNNGVITWTKEKVAAGETFEVTFKVKVDENAGGNIVKNKANVLEGNNKFETNETTNPTSTKPKKEAQKPIFKGMPKDYSVIPLIRFISFSYLRSLK